jgi:hypothetical protein
MHGNGKALWFWLAALTVGFAAGPVDGQQAFLGPDQAAALLTQARPHLEAVLGDRLERLPQVRLATAEELRHWEQPELDTQVRWQFPDLAGEPLDRALEAARALDCSATVARYVGNETIVLLPDHLASISRWHESLAPVNAPAFLQLALVHETVRYCLDRRYELRKQRAACRDNEAFLALQALDEGRAQWATWQVAGRLGTQTSFPLLARLMLHAPDPAPDPFLRAVSQQALRQRHWARVQGLAFYCYLEENGLRDVEKQVFARPPGQLLWINRPELFVRAVQAQRSDLDARLEQLEASLPPAEWSAVRQPWTPAMVCQVAGMLGERERAEGLVRPWEEGRLCVWSSKKSPDRQVAVGVVRFENAAAARAYYGFAVDMQRKQDERLANSGGFPHVAGSQARAVTLPGTDEAQWRDKRMQWTANAEPTPVNMLVVRAGVFVVEITWHGQPGDRSWAEGVLQKVVDGQ